MRPDAQAALPSNRGQAAREGGGGEASRGRAGGAKGTGPSVIGLALWALKQAWALLAPLQSQRASQ